MDRKDFAIACQRFAESQRLDPAPGTLMNLAECLDRRGLVASSWQKWKEALDSLRPGDPRVVAVKRHIAKSLARLPKLELRLAESAAAGSTVTRDGLVLGEGSLGIALPVDPGPHRVVVTAPGHEPREYTTTLAEKESQSLTVEAGPAEAPRPPPRPAPTVAKGPDDGSRTSAGSGRTMGLVATSVGAAGLVLGGVTGALALSKKSTMNDECSRSGGELLCTQRGLDAAHAGSTFATISNVGFIAGVIGLGVGTYFLVTSGGGGRSAAISARATPTSGSVDLSCTF